MAATRAIESVQQPIDVSAKAPATPQNFRFAYALFRLTLGLNFFMHGFARLFTGLGTFVAVTEKPFLKQGIVPMPVVHYFLTILPFCELTVGLLLLFGLFTRWALFAGATIMIILVFGTTAKQEWGAAGNQMLYAAYYCFLIYRIQDNWLALDNYRRPS